MTETRFGSLAAERGQVLVVGAASLALLALGTAVLTAYGRGLLGQGRHQSGADLAAVSAARSMRENFNRLLVPATTPDGEPNPDHLERTEYLNIARGTAIEYARRNGLKLRPGDVTFPDDQSFAPLRVRIKVRGRVELDSDRSTSKPEAIPVRATAEAEVSYSSSVSWSQSGQASGGGYDGPLAYRQGKPMRPDVAQAFDRMSAEARRDGVSLIVNSAFRSDAEQARLFRAHPDPKWVAPPGKSLHRLATELDLGPPSAYGWLSSNAGRFGFIQRYSWEPWHYGYTRNPRSTPESFRGVGRPKSLGGEGKSALPSFVPSQYVRSLAQAAQRYGVSASVLAAQIQAESNFNPFQTSPAGAQGIAQFLPGTARSYGLRDPFDSDAAIDAQGRLMRDLLQRFGAVELALAAYNAGPLPVSKCGCVPNFPETQAYVAKIMGLLGGAGDLPAVTEESLEVRLVS